MKKFLFLFSLLIFTSLSSIEANEIILIRKLFFEAATSQTKTEYMHNYLKKKNLNSSPTVRAYFGMTHMLLAKHGLNFFARLNNFNKGKEELEQAIALDKTNIELRFLRLSVQINVPAFLNYSSNIENDKKLIASKFQNLSDEDLKKRIKEFYFHNKMSI